MRIDLKLWANLNSSIFSEMLQLAVFYSQSKIFQINNNDLSFDKSEVESFIANNICCSSISKIHLIHMAIDFMRIAIDIRKQVHSFFTSDANQQIFSMSTTQKKGIEILLTQYGVLFAFDNMCQDFNAMPSSLKLKEADEFKSEFKKNNILIESISGILVIENDKVTRSRFIELIKLIISCSTMKYDELKESLQASCLALSTGFYVH